MQSLESYLASEYFNDEQDMRALERSLAGIGATFAHLRDKMGWPYKYPSTDPIVLSPGTVAMIVTSLGRMTGRCALASGRRRPLVKDKDGGKDLGDAFDAGLELLASSSPPGELISTTFGNDNPLTLSHVAELKAALDTDKYSEQITALDQLMAGAKTKLEGLLKKGSSAIGDSEVLIEPEPKRNYYHINAFVPLRALRAAGDLRIEFEKAKNRTFFESLLHDQLSFSAIPDSRFDPAELIFCLEGLLLCARSAVDATLFSRVVEVLAEKQNTSAHWRPNKPFIGWSTGAILLPLSVEAANSLMRSVAQMDGRQTYNTYTAKVLPLMRRFWHWLLARAVKIEVGGKARDGWHSEHINQPDIIHPWDTSQVAEFMMGYFDLLDRHVAAQTLRLSRLSVKDPKTLDSLDLEDSNLVMEEWGKTVDRFDPSPGTLDKVYHQIGKDFVNGWAKHAPTSYSMLLYGPPGTGKTTVAEKLSETLGMRLITVTVSDFLGAGGENVETRAKAIFQTLEAQSNTVILFDEIDSFLLDRDSDRYSKQDSVFQFLTPGMLTKFNDLRKCERSIFVVATNYENRIDPAIKRTGRIDHKYLLPLPNAKRRVQIMESLGLNTTEHRDALVTASVLRGFSDIKGAIQSAKSSTVGSEAEEVVDLLKRAKPATSVGVYLSRLATDKPFPHAELDGIIVLIAEAKARKVLEEEFGATGDEGQQHLEKRYGREIRDLKCDVGRA